VADTKKRGLDQGLNEKCSVGCKSQENEFLERSACSSTALDKQSNLNCDSKPFSLYKDIA
jgi:hypothetical protein